jgi:hypothetical protein
MTKTCSTCLHFVTSECTRFPAWLIVSPDHYCGEHRSALIAENGTERKFDDEQLIKRIRENYGKPITWGEGLDLVAQDFGVSKKTIEDHCKRLARMQIFEIDRGPHGRRINVDVHPAVDNWEWWLEHCAKSGEKPELVWKTMVDKGEIPWPGKGTVARKERPAMVKWTFAEHLLPAMVAVCPTEATAARYSRISEAVATLHKLPRSAFDRLMRHAVEDGKAGKTDGGLYYLKSQ